MWEGRKWSQDVESDDHRGRTVRLYVPGPVSLLRGTPEGFEAMEFARIRRRITGPDAAHGGLKAALALMMLITGAAALIRLFEEIVFGDWWPFVRAGLSSSPLCLSARN